MKHSAIPRTARLAVAMVAAAGALLATPALHAEKADRTKPLNVEADRMEYDDLKQVNVFTGDVTLTKGTIIIRGDRVTARQDPQGYQYGESIGKPAYFRQKRDNVDQFIEGRADRIQYDGKLETVTLTGNASMKRLEREQITDEIYGNVIVYDSRTEFVTVDGKGGTQSTDGRGRGRVRVIIQPRNEEGQSAAAAPAAPVATPAPAPAPPRPSGRGAPGSAVKP